MPSKPELSIVVPFYNAKHTLKRCLDSIVLSCEEISTEIICVDDGSTDGGQKLVEELYGRNVRVYSHKTNMGLFQARLTALKHVRGKYIGFVDSDDYVSQNYFSELYQIICKEKTDVAVGRIVVEDSDGVMYMQTRCLNFPYGGKEDGQSYYDLYWDQAGACYPWHVLWNKLYKRDLWKEKWKILKKMDAHITMMEDFIYSSIVLSGASAFSSGCEGVYYYIQSGEASTSQEATYGKWEQNIQDMGIAFNKVESFLKKKSEFCVYLDFLEKWKERYSRYWFRNICASNLIEKEKNQLNNLLKSVLHITELNVPSEADEYYYIEAESYCVQA